jgi:DNA-binding NtrC family response regulator
MSVVLLVSNDRELAATVQSAVELIQNCELRRIASIAGLNAALRDDSICLAIVHMLADMDVDTGALHAALKRLGELSARVATLVVCDQYDGQEHLRYLRLGAQECLTRPLDLRRLGYLIESLSMRSRLESARARQPAANGDAFYKAASPVMRELLKRTERIAARDVSILLTGETGVGKTHLARWIHRHSPRSLRPFLSVNCGSLPTNLIESELFGHKKGAFTGADDDRVGKFAHVQDGTMLLDEIDALALAAQAKLLHVLDDGVFEQVGSNKPLAFRGRLIAASNRSLEELIERDQFRADLYYRLNVVQFHLPPLRERMSEIRPAVHYFLGALAEKHGLAVPVVDDEIWRLLERYPWPGNLRELHNAIEHAIILCDSATMGVRHFPALLHARRDAVLDLPPDISNGRRLPVAENLSQKRSRSSLAEARQEGEYRFLVEVLDLCDNNRSQAARALGISRAALYKKLVSLGIS